MVSDQWVCNAVIYVGTDGFLYQFISIGLTNGGVLLSRTYNNQFRNILVLMQEVFLMVTLLVFLSFSLPDSLGFTGQYLALLLLVFFLLDTLLYVSLRFFVYKRMFDVSKFFNCILSPSSITFISFEGGTGMPYFGLKRPAMISTQHDWSLIHRISVKRGGWLKCLEIEFKNQTISRYDLSLTKYGISCMLADIKTSTSVLVDTENVKQLPVRLPYSHSKDVMISTSFCFLEIAFEFIILAIAWNVLF